MFFPTSSPGLSRFGVSVENLTEPPLVESAGWCIVDPATIDLANLSYHFNGQPSSATGGRMLRISHDHRYAEQQRLAFKSQAPFSAMRASPAG